MRPADKSGMDLETGITVAIVDDIIVVAARISGSESESEDEAEELDSRRRRLSKEGTEDSGGESTAVDDDSVTVGSGVTASTLALGTITKSPTFALWLLVCTGSLAGNTAGRRRADNVHTSPQRSRAWFKKK